MCILKGADPKYNKIGKIFTEKGKKSVIFLKCTDSAP